MDAGEQQDTRYKILKLITQDKKVKLNTRHKKIMTIKVKQENGYRDLNYIQGTQGRQDKLQEGIQH